MLKKIRGDAWFNFMVDFYYAANENYGICWILGAIERGNNKVDFNCVTSIYYGILSYIKRVMLACLYGLKSFSHSLPVEEIYRSLRMDG